MNADLLEHWKNISHAEKNHSSARRLVSIVTRGSPSFFNALLDEWDRPIRRIVADSSDLHYTSICFAWTNKMGEVQSFAEKNDDC